MEYDYPSFDSLASAAGVTTISAANDPNAANAVLEGLFDAGSAPMPPIPGTDLVYLPNGYMEADGEATHEARVRELTGADEEALAKAGTNPFRYFDTVIKRGTLEIGPYQVTDKLLRSLTVGDREALLLGIRIATYGQSYTWEEWRCPECGELTDLTFHLPDLFQTKPASREYSVKLRERVAHMRLPTGDDQAKLYEREDLTVPEQNTIMIGRCLRDLTGMDRQIESGGGLEVARNLGVVDRNAIIKAMAARSRGPRLEDIELVHEDCGKDVKVTLALVALFR